MSKAATTVQKSSLAKIVITTTDGRTFNLGKPDSFLFPLRLSFYKLMRRKEINKHG